MRSLKQKNLSTSLVLYIRFYDIHNPYKSKSCYVSTQLKLCRQFQTTEVYIIVSFVCAIYYQYKRNMFNKVMESECVQNIFLTTSESSWVLV